MKYNIENRIKDNALVNLTDFENAIDLYEDGEAEKALELVFGLITLGLGGEFETDDREIRRLLRNREYTVARSNKAYCNKVGSDETKQRAKLQLDDIAEMMANGATQQIIADSLCVSLDTIKYRVKVMKEKYPALYTESVKKCKKVGVSGSNDNVNDNEKENGNGKGNVKTPPNLFTEGTEMKLKRNTGDESLSYLENEVLADGYVEKEEKWLDEIIPHFGCFSNTVQTELLKEKLGYSDKEAKYILDNILDKVG
nr:MAG TPA: Transcriptional regulatory protein RcsB regulator Transcriptional factor, TRANSCRIPTION.1A [Caudoviricetes sp.]